jgi:hypothetical protein
MAAENVTPIRKAGEPIAVATATAIVVGLTNNRQITFQTGHEGNEDPETVFNRYMGVMKIADRLQAVYEIPEIEEELFKHRETLANFLEDKRRLEAAFEVSQAERQVTIDEMRRSRPEMKAAKLAEMNAAILDMQKRRGEFYGQGHEEFRRRGRTGSYTPAGATKATLDRIELGIKQAGEARDAEMTDFDAKYDASIAGAEAEMARAEAERDQALANLGISIDRYNGAISEREERLAKRKVVAEG